MQGWRVDAYSYWAAALQKHDRIGGRERLMVQRARSGPVPNTVLVSISLLRGAGLRSPQHAQVKAASQVADEASVPCNPPCWDDL